MNTDLDETKVQVLFLPVNVYLEDTIAVSIARLIRVSSWKSLVLQRNRTDQHLSTGVLQLSGLVLRGHAMLSHEGLPPERETLEYAWQMEILLGDVSARLTTIQVKLHLTLSFFQRHNSSVSSFLSDRKTT